MSDDGGRASVGGSTSRAWELGKHAHHDTVKAALQKDGWVIFIANELLDLGVPKQSIVMRFHDPNARKLMEFATG